MSTLFAPQRLRTRLTISHGLVVVVAVVLVALISTVLINRGFQQLAQLQARREATQIAEVLGEASDGPATDTDVLQRIRRRLDAPRQPAFVRSAPFVLTNPQLLVVLDRGGNLEGKPLPALLRRNATPVLVDGRTVGYVALPPERWVINAVERQVLARMYLGVAVGSLLAGLLALTVGLTISRRLTRPLQSLTAAARQLAAGKRLEPVPITTGDEVGDLGHAFNTMARELEHQQNLRRNLVADIAHELRTPLSVLRLHIESLQDGVAVPSAATFASLAEETALLSHIVADLRTLSLADAGQLTVACTVVDPAEIVRRSAANALPRAQSQRVALHCNVQAAPPTVSADPQRLAQVLGGLLDNALRYTPPGGHVTLAVQARPQAGNAPSVIFAVSDSGPGIAPADLPHIFERFYRADQARSRETGGSGLGLAIAQRLVEAMGGQIWAESTPGSGAQFFVALPLTVDD